MCFRPTEVKEVPVCPNCGKKVPIVGGVRQKKCPFCHAEMPAAPAANAPAAPDVPKAPGAPGAPKAPAPPGAPKVK